MKKILLFFHLVFLFSYSQWEEVITTSVDNNEITIYNNKENNTVGTSYLSKNKNLLDTLFKSEVNLLVDKTIYQDFTIGKQQYKKKFLAFKRSGDSLIEIDAQTEESLKNSITQWLNPTAQDTQQ
ncbi:hypothetical protein H3N56_00615 [Cetobacterium sp. 2A]|uniref:hypothetical protein n=1 Tax=Cetobacterium sp. 2A TaxID=2754723 RepID=UPI00163B7B42|nr:hypothetical protein [Cetobacterium sp. 2A]MBC2854999.1 hypothetical protein [Cetobacterium sp. 2A]